VTDLVADGRLARTLGLWLGFFAAALILHLILNWLPLLLQGRGLSKVDAAAAQIAFNIVGAAGAMLAGFGLDRSVRPAGVALAVVAVPAALLALALGPPVMVFVTLAAGLLGAGVLAQTIVLYGAAGACYPESILGTGLGAAVGASRVGALAGPSLGAVLLSAGRSPTEVLTSLAPVVLSAAACVIWLGWRAPRPAPTEVAA
jgi:AAHS family 3-hydroxyphenylpropionic acid transporter